MGDSSRAKEWLCVLATVAGVVACTTSVQATDWQPTAWAKEDTLKLRTTAPGEEEHWFPVWLVVIDGQLYVRLGSRAAGRVERNVSAPFLGVEIAGQRFDRARGVPAPEDADRVAAALADKYTSDILVRFFSHPLTLRLEAEDSAAAPVIP